MLNNNIKILLVSFVHHIELQNFLNAPRNFRKCTSISTIFTVRTINLWRMKVRLCPPPHLYSVTALPSKTRYC